MVVDLPGRGIYVESSVLLSDDAKGSMRAASQMMDDHSLSYSPNDCTNEEMRPTTMATATETIPTLGHPGLLSAVKLN